MLSRRSRGINRCFSTFISDDLKGLTKIQIVAEIEKMLSNRKIVVPSRTQTYYLKRKEDLLKIYDNMLKLNNTVNQFSESSMNITFLDRAVAGSGVERQAELPKRWSEVEEMFKFIKLLEKMEKEPHNVLNDKAILLRYEEPEVMIEMWKKVFYSLDHFDLDELFHIYKYAQQFESMFGLKCASTKEQLVDEYLHNCLLHVNKIVEKDVGDALTLSKVVMHSELINSDTERLLNRTRLAVLNKYVDHLNGLREDSSLVEATPKDLLTIFQALPHNSYDKCPEVVDDLWGKLVPYVRWFDRDPYIAVLNALRLNNVPISKEMAECFFNNPHYGRFDLSLIQEYFILKMFQVSGVLNKVTVMKALKRFHYKSIRNTEELQTMVKLLQIVGDSKAFLNFAYKPERLFQDAPRLNQYLACVNEVRQYIESNDVPTHVLLSAAQVLMPSVENCDFLADQLLTKNLESLNPREMNDILRVVDLTIHKFNRREEKYYTYRENIHEKSFHTALPADSPFLNLLDHILFNFMLIRSQPYVLKLGEILQNKPLFRAICELTNRSERKQADYILNFLKKLTKIIETEHDGSAAKHTLELVKLMDRHVEVTSAENFGALVDIIISKDLKYEHFSSLTEKVDFMFHFQNILSHAKKNSFMSDPNLVDLAEQIESLDPSIKRDAQLLAEEVIAKRNSSGELRNGEVYKILYLFKEHNLNSKEELLRPLSKMLESRIFSLRLDQLLPLMNFLQSNGISLHKYQKKILLNMLNEEVPLENNGLAGKYIRLLDQCVTAAKSEEGEIYSPADFRLLPLFAYVNFDSLTFEEHLKVLRLIEGSVLAGDKNAFKYISNIKRYVLQNFDSIQPEQLASLMSIWPPTCNFPELFAKTGSSMDRTSKVHGSSVSETINRLASFTQNFLELPSLVGEAVRLSKNMHGNEQEKHLQSVLLRYVNLNVTNRNPDVESLLQRILDVSTARHNQEDLVNLLCYQLLRGDDYTQTYPALLNAIRDQYHLEEKLHYVVEHDNEKVVLPYYTAFSAANELKFFKKANYYKNEKSTLESIMGKESGPNMGFSQGSAERDSELTAFKLEEEDLRFLNQKDMSVLQTKLILQEMEEEIPYHLEKMCNSLQDGIIMKNNFDRDYVKMMTTTIQSLMERKLAYKLNYNCPGTRWNIDIYIPDLRKAILICPGYNMFRRVNTNTNSLEPLSSHSMYHLIKRQLEHYRAYETVDLYQGNNLDEILTSFQAF